MVLNAVQHRAQPELRVVQEAQQQLHRAVAGAPAQPRHAPVEPVGSLDGRLDGIGERQLPVVVGMHPHRLPGRRRVAQERIHVAVDLLRVQRPEAVDDADGVRLRLRHQGQRLVQLAVRHRRQRHQVQARLVALVMGMLDHVEGQRDLVDIGGHPDHVQDALRFRQDVLPVVALVGVGHRRQLQRGLVVSDDAAEVALDAVLPRAELPRRKLPARVDVPDLHVVDAALDARLIHRLHRLVAELVVVHQTAVPNGAVQHLDLGAVRHPIARRARLRLSLTHHAISPSSGRWRESLPRAIAPFPLPEPAHRGDP